VVFVYACDHHFFDALMASLVSLVSRFHYSYKKIIVYDLDGISDDPHKVEELGRVCNLELRRFNYTGLPPHVKVLKHFAWKIFVEAEVLAEHDFVIYMDTSVFFLENDYADYFDLIGKGVLSSIQFTRHTSHGIKFATLPGISPFDCIGVAHSL